VKRGKGELGRGAGWGEGSSGFFREKGDRKKMGSEGSNLTGWGDKQ